MTGKKEYPEPSCWLQLTKLQNKWPLNYDTKYEGFKRKQSFFKTISYTTLLNKISVIVFNSVNKFINIIFVISFLNFLIFLLAGPGYQIGLFHWRTGLLVIMKYTAFISIPLIALIVLTIITALIGKFESKVKSKKLLIIALIFKLLFLSLFCIGKIH